MTLLEYTKSLVGKRIAVVGIGVSNTPLIKHLAANGVQVTACDRSTREQLGARADELEGMGCVLKLGNTYLDDLDADIIFRTPGLHPDTPGLVAARARGAVMTSEMEAFFEVCPCKIIAVTGSDGKTTTTTLIATILEAEGYTVHIGGNIGRPLLCDADDMKPDDICVLELSSFQLMTMTKSPDIAVVTNLAPNHLDIHKDMDEYVWAKKNIFVHQTGGVLVLNEDNAITASFIGEEKGELRTFSRLAPTQNGACVSGGVLSLVGKEGIIPVVAAGDIFLPGLHNVENYLAAFAAVKDFVSVETMAKVAKTFTGVEHRIEFVRKLNGVSYYNDSIASSPSRTTAGLHAFEQKVILIAGGKDKGVPFDGLAEEIITHVKTLVVTGATAETIYSCVLNSPNYKGAPIVVREDDFKAAVIAASKQAEDGDVVLLSPACTSFDRFKNFAERGKYFKEIVNALEE